MPVPLSLPGILRRYAVERGFEIALAARANELIDHLAVFEKEQGGNGIDAVLRRELLLFVRVDLGDFDFAVVFGRQFIQQWVDHFAPPAPFSPPNTRTPVGRVETLSRNLLPGQRDH